MQALIYYICLPFIYLISILPFPLLYLFSDLIFFLVYSVFGYRKKIVLANLRNSFPDKTEEEINTICKDFYSYFCDLFVETAKILTISKEEMLKRFRMTAATTELMNKLYEEKKSCILVMGHYGNWEYPGHPFNLLFKQKLLAIYHPLENKYFDSLMIKIRSRFGTKMISMQNTFREMLVNKNIVTATVFIADQTPSPENAYWTTFLNQDTPIFRGTEVIARKLNYPVIYVTSQRIKRGYYEGLSEVICEEPQKTAEGEISELHTRKLEKDIIQCPETWLWSHRRWKHTKR